MMGKGRARNQKGGAAIEAALVLPLTILLIFGMIEFGLLLYNRQIITNASREGARAGIVLSTPRLTDPEIGSVVAAYCQDRLVTFGTAAGPSTSAPGAGTACVFGTDLTVRVSYDYDFLVMTNFGFGPVQLEAETVMRCE
jgi:Flp pilus assembly protein TadG